MHLANRHIKPVSAAKGITAYKNELHLKHIRDQINAPAEKPTAIYVPSLHPIFAGAGQYNLCIELLEHVAHRTCKSAQSLRPIKNRLVMP